ncbi:Protein grc3/RNA processing protein Grc3 [Blumeria hordei DH14]|uniref:Polynucleotide 5'-hydroxyl-kinase GRC3 n=1 Tax=Blumeria graminis f. sp. hordei (strain DH14) TaxID=546991 RepID=N1J782_BLUG1|nr:Protein grc3/RNA processing protein Grc3 [Blumeria hordei DH14]
MSSSKRRKLELVPESKGQSAFAARQALKANACTQESSKLCPLDDHAVKNLCPHRSDEPQVYRSPEDNSPKERLLKSKEHTLPRVDSDSKDESKVSDQIEEIDKQKCSEPQVVLPLAVRPEIVLSTIKPSHKNLRQLENGSVYVKIAPGERLVVLGQYGILVHKGEITLLGATLKRSKSLFKVYALPTHSLPVIRSKGTIISTAEISLHPVESGLENLKFLSPLYGSLWGDNCGILGPKYQNLFQESKSSTFQILFSSTEGPQKSYVQPLSLPPEWNICISNCLSASLKTNAIMVCGPKSTGKSTFVKFLLNRLLSKNDDPVKRQSAVLLDLDPGQPEYSPPGQLSLIHVMEPNLGTPFSHPVPGCQNIVLKSHSIAATSPAMDSDLFMACSIDLFSTYRDLGLHINCIPLVINTPGWILGTGLEILVSLVKNIRPTEVIYMSQEGPPEVVKSLQEADKSTSFITVPSQICETPIRTAAHLRTMQYMSYFHLEFSKKNSTVWNSQPLTSIPPWEIKYSGNSSGILGIMCYGEQPPLGLISETINGTIVSVVVVDDFLAIPGWSSNLEGQVETEVRSDLSKSDFCQVGKIETPLILRSPEDLPYFNPANAISLHPKYSYCLGLALVRGIDVSRRRIQLLTPISPNIIEDLQQNRKSIILLSGKLDTPGWAYTEDLLLRAAVEKGNIIQYGSGKSHKDNFEGKAEMDCKIDDRKTFNTNFKEIPWVEKLEGSQGRGVGSRVWRVRRDLGKTSESWDS